MSLQVLAAVVAGTVAASEPRSFGKSGQVVIGVDTHVLVANAVARSQPYYALRGDRRTLLLARASGDMFFNDRWSLGGGLLISHERAASLRPVTDLALGLRLGFVVVRTATWALWPTVGAAAGLELRGGGDVRLAASVSADLRFVYALRGSALLSFGPRLDHEVGQVGGERVASLVVGFLGLLERDKPTATGTVAAARRPGARGMRWVGAEAGLLFAARSFAGVTEGWLPAMMRVQASLDGFVREGVSLGAWLGVASAGDEAARVTAMVAGARVGWAVPGSRTFWWWPRLGLHLSRAQASTTILPTSVLDASMSLPLVLPLAEHLAFAVGPVVTLPLARTAPRTPFAPSLGVESTFFVKL